MHPTVLPAMAPKTCDENDGDATQDDSNGGSSSYFQKTVCLSNWWLVKAEKESEGRRLAVAGSTSMESKAFRLFTSAAIAKRHDVFTLQTADGVCVCLRGFINKQRTLENGFSSEVFTHFYLGFPPDWEKYAKECFGEIIPRKVELEVVPNSSIAARDSDPSLILTPTNLADNVSTMVEERSNLDSSQKKDIDSTTKASPVTKKTKGTQLILSPESLNLKRSRSGRVLLPPMEFWRNQIPVYDQDRSITGIKEGMNDTQLSGSRSNPKRHKKVLPSVMKFRL